MFYWLALLSVIPTDRREGAVRVRELRQFYKKTLNHYLNPENRNAKLMSCVYKDVVRTKSAIHWFAAPDPVEDTRLEGDLDGFLPRALASSKYAALFRILYTAACLAGYYSQGQNELAAMVMHTFHSDRFDILGEPLPPRDFSGADFTTEALVFAAFRGIVGWAEPLFIHPTDRRPFVSFAPGDTAATVRRKLGARLPPSTVVDFLEAVELIAYAEQPEVVTHLARFGVRAPMYAMAWATPLYCQILPLPEMRQACDMFIALAAAPQRDGGALDPSFRLQLGGVICFTACTLLELASDLLAASDLSLLMSTLQAPPIFHTGISPAFKARVMRLWAAYICPPPRRTGAQRLAATLRLRRKGK
eukprot:gnl/Chilomastix_cuspidata/5198.p1 GENE.gnl/Chilomastix_cuspidata/5198~~gnl/Chilomastix_cuspidata/5198.p1  ORF type:complete len:418 (-),score=138.38 gnl/Chilomastix_cuspidata/5198:27-1109(-)